MSTATSTVPAGPSPLDRGRLRARLAAGEGTLGTFVGAASPVTAEASERAFGTLPPAGGLVDLSAPGLGQ